MLTRIDFASITFGRPEVLWLLVGPALLLVLWGWRLIRRGMDLRALARHRTLPTRERYAFAGDLPFWLCLILASSLLIVALARPRGPASSVRQGGIDMVILQDGSASMYVKDVEGDRWQRSMRFLRTLGDSLTWNSDRIALTLFAHVAAPQIRLTKDPNTFFFFLDHLEAAPPFRVEDETTWDTNLQLGINWGLKLIERDEEMYGKNPNAKMFLLLSDGETWSGEVQTAVRQAVARGIPIYVVGVGTLAGGAMPVFRDEKGEIVNDPDVPRTSRLDRAGLQRLANASGGMYFELDRDGERRITNAIVDAGKKMAPTLGLAEATEELYWRFVAMAALLPFLGMLFLRDRSELWLQAVGALAILVGASTVLR